MSDAQVEIAGETLRLLPERAAYWEPARTLFVADIHLGKTATHNAFGRPLPQGDTADDLSRLSRALARSGARILVVLGDLLHAARGRDAATLGAFAAWRAEHDHEIILVQGNHDRGAGPLPAAWDIAVLNDPAALPPFMLTHAPAALGAYTLSGHLHPGIELTGRGRQLLRLPCFWFAARCGVLPAFGSFTGAALIRPAPDDAVFAVTPSAVVPVPARDRPRP